MCGNVGLFTGCAAPVRCPRKQLSFTRTNRTDSDGYTTPFRSWYERASVRRAPRRMLTEADSVGRFFPADLVPLARHPTIAELPAGVFEAVLVQHLYRYLDFTAKLESMVVNRTALGIAQGTLGVELPEEMRFDAYKIYCDEAYHALFSADLLRQVRDVTGIEPALPERPYFLTRLERIQEAAGGALAGLVELLFVIVSETLISGSLAEIPDDPEVVPAVRAVVRDHAADEGRHHTYFAAFLRYLWGQLDPPTRRRVGLLVPELIEAFLHPDLPAVRTELRGYGLDAEASEQVLAEVFAPDVVAAHVRAASRQTTRHFAGLGVLDDPPVRAAFAQHGLL